ncbi:RRF domain-containing protein [Aphelenchoides bicaudatus]|nr:RRF domain-containing protein [Aphelenchoides bicaudatus]
MRSILTLAGRVLSTPSIKKQAVPVQKCRLVWTTPAFAKQHQKSGGDKQKFPSILECNSDVMKPYFNKIKAMEETLCEQLDKRLSLRTDLRLYEDFSVTCPDGKHKLANLGQISKKAKIPSVIHHAKHDLQAAIPDANVQQEGAYLYIKTQPISRERRTDMISKTKTYSEYSKKFETTIACKDTLERNRKIILQNKRIMETRAEALFKQREDSLMAEII